MAFTYRDMGHAFHDVFSVIAGWIAEMLFMLFFFILLYNGQNIAEYKAYLLMGFPIIDLWGVHFTSTFSVFSVMAG